MVSLLAVLAIMTIGYAAFSTQLEIKGTSNIDSRWEVKIIAISAGTPVGTAENAVAPSYTDTTANMNVNLYAPGDSMTYEITIQNNGTLDAVLNSITENNSNNDTTYITSDLFLYDINRIDFDVTKIMRDTYFVYEFNQISDVFVYHHYSMVEQEVEQQELYHD